MWPWRRSGRDDLKIPQTTNVNDDTRHNNTQTNVGADAGDPYDDDHGSRMRWLQLLPWPGLPPLLARRQESCKPAFQRLRLTLQERVPLTAQRQNAQGQQQLQRLRRQYTPLATHTLELMQYAAELGCNLLIAKTPSETVARAIVHGIVYPIWHDHGLRLFATSSSSDGWQRAGVEVRRQINRMMRDGRAFQEQGIELFDDASFGIERTGRYLFICPPWAIISDRVRDRDREITTRTSIRVCDIQRSVLLKVQAVVMRSRVFPDVLLQLIWAYLIGYDERDDPQYADKFQDIILSNTMNNVHSFCGQSDI